MKLDVTEKASSGRSPHAFNWRCGSPERDLHNGLEVATLMSSNSIAGFGVAEMAGSLHPLCAQLSGEALREPASDELLTMLLSYVLPLSEARHRAAALLARFGSMGAVLTAPAAELASVLTRIPAAVALLKGMHKAMVMALREPVEDRPVFNTWSDLETYLRISLAHESEEVVRLLLLNRRNVLLQDEEHSRGSINHTPVYPRKIVTRVIETRATALIIVHNHPSGDPTPSADDIKLTQQLEQVLQSIGVALHDHIVVGRHRCASLRQLGVMG